jgi:hypothetical protein
MDFVPTTLKPSEALTVRLLFLPSNLKAADQSSAELAVTTSQVLCALLSTHLSSFISLL